MAMNGDRDHINTHGRSIRGTRDDFRDIPRRLEQLAAIAPQEAFTLAQLICNVTDRLLKYEKDRRDG